jgi:vancomycin resistance protein YoaR
MGKSIKVLLYITIFAVTALFVSAGVIIYNTSSAEKNIFNGVSINNINVGGMSKDNARKILEEKFNKPISNKIINLNSGKYKYTLQYGELNAHYDIDTVVNKAYEYGKTGNFINKTRNRLLLKKEPVNINMEFVLDTSVISKVIKNINQKVYKDPKDAKISFDGSSFKVTPDEVGIKVDEKNLEQMISEAVKPESTVDNITVPTETINAKIKGDMLSKINTKISSFTTVFKPSDVNRTENIRIASKQTNGVLILPGDVFSMNKALGPRVISKGYKEAPVIIKGTVVPGLAGGICQVTTTIYNAALLSNLEIVERSQHGLTVSYVGVGRDATISGDAIDFKFRNTNKYPIYVYTAMGKSSLTVSLYGANEHPGQFVQIASEITERVVPDIEYIYDESLDNGIKITEVKPITGIKSKTYKKVFQDGKLISNELINQDFYKPVKGKIRVGTKPVSNAQVPGTNTEPTDTDGGNVIPETGTYPR